MNAAITPSFAGMAAIFAVLVGGWGCAGNRQSPLRTPPFSKVRVEPGIRVPWDVPARRWPHAGGHAACKAGGIFGRKGLLTNRLAIYSRQRETQALARLSKHLSAGRPANWRSTRNCAEEFKIHQAVNVKMKDPLTLSIPRVNGAGAPATKSCVCFLK